MVTESSKANLRKGSLKTKGGGAIRKTLSLHPDSVEWLEQQPNMSSAIDELIAERSLRRPILRKRFIAAYGSQFAIAYYQKQVKATSDEIDYLNSLGKNNKDIETILIQKILILAHVAELKNRLEALKLCVYAAKSHPWVEPALNGDRCDGGDVCRCVFDRGD